MEFRDSSLLIKEHTECLENATREVESLLDNTHQFLNDFSKLVKKKDEEEQKIAVEFVQHSTQLNNYVDQLHGEIRALINVIKTSDKQLSDYRKDIDSLKLDNEKYKKENEELKEKLEEQKKLSIEYEQKYEQSKDDCSLHLTYSAAMGSVLTTMLWKTSKSQEAIDTYIETGTMNQFLNLANNTITTFEETYSLELPHHETFEFKFIVSLLGICINIVAQRAGREYVLERTIGEDLIRNVVKFLGYLPISGGKLPKRLTLMLLYNLTFSKQGTNLIQVSEGSVDNIIKCFNSNHSIEIQSIAVALLDQMLNESQTSGFSSKVIHKISQNEDDFKNLMEKSDSKTKDICKQLLRKLREINNDLSLNGGF